LGSTAQDRLEPALEWGWGSEAALGLDLAVAELVLNLDTIFHHNLHRSIQNCNTLRAGCKKLAWLHNQNNSICHLLPQMTPTRLLPL
jgi:hypothetical protein